MPNESLIHADIFFFISTIALVLISIGIVIATIYVIKILKNIREISDKVNAESTEIVSDVKKLRHALRDEGIKWKHVTDLIRSFFMRKGKKIKETVETLKK
jgi:uncharacterized protein YoxC